MYQSLRGLSDAIELLEERRTRAAKEAKTAFRQAIVERWTFQQIIDAPNNGDTLAELEQLEEAFIASSTECLDHCIELLNKKVARMSSSIDLRACTFEETSSNPSVNLLPLNRIA